MGSYILPNQKIRGPDWLMLGSLGTGTYLGTEDEATDEAVACGVIAGVGRGWNVIDTASNYRNGRCFLLSSPPPPPPLPPPYLPQGGSPTPCTAQRHILYILLVMCKPSFEEATFLHKQPSVPSQDLYDPAKRMPGSVCPVFLLAYRICSSQSCGHTVPPAVDVNQIINSNEFDLTY